MGHETYLSADIYVSSGKSEIFKNPLRRISNFIANRSKANIFIDEKYDGDNKAVRIDLLKALEIAEDKNTIVIYPEVVKGNPLLAHKVARWVLFFPGVNGGDQIYDSTEFVFTYSPEFVENTIYQSAPLVRIIDTLIDNFFELDQPRTTDYLLIKKGSFDRENRTKLYLEPEKKRLFNLKSADEIINESHGVSDFNLKLNRARFFISYDHHTYHSVLAALAGCKSVVIPEIEKSEEAFFAGFPEAKIAGVSYGFKDITSEPINQEAFRLEKERIEANNLQFAANLTSNLASFFVNPEY